MRYFFYVISKIISVALVASLSALPLMAQNNFYFSQIGDGAIGPIKFQTSLIFVNVGANTSLQINFFRSPDGQPMPLTLIGMGPPASLFNIPLLAGQSISMQTSGTGGIQVGYARITVAAGGDVGGTAVFTRTDIPSGKILYEAGVPAVTELNDFSLFVDTLGDRDTGLAIANVSDSGGQSLAGGAPNIVKLTLYNKAFQQIATTDVPLAKGHHLPRFIPQIFDAVPVAAEMEGSVAVSSPDKLAAVTLRANDASGIDFPDEVPTLTSFPVIKGKASMAGFGAFSALADGSVAIVLDLTLEKRPVIGGIFYLFDGDKPVYQAVRDMSGQGIVALTVTVESPQAGAVNVDRVEVELIFKDGERSSRYLLGS